MTIRFERTIENESWTTHETQAVGLRDVIQDFAYFLKGIGYEFEGTLDITNDDNEHHLVNDDESNQDSISFHMGVVNTLQAKIAELEEALKIKHVANQQLDELTEEQEKEIKQLKKKVKKLQAELLNHQPWCLG